MWNGSEGAGLNLDLNLAWWIGLDWIGCRTEDYSVVRGTDRGCTALYRIFKLKLKSRAILPWRVNEYTQNALRLLDTPDE